MESTTTSWQECTGKWLSFDLARVESVHLKGATATEIDVQEVQKGAE